MWHVTCDMYHVPWNRLLCFPAESHTSNWHMWLVFFELVCLFFSFLVSPSYCVHVLFIYNRTRWYSLEEYLKRGMKGSESWSSPWVLHQELKLDPTYWEAREPVSPNKAQPPPLSTFNVPCPGLLGFGTRGSMTMPGMKALSPACSEAKTACF